VSDEPPLLESPHFEHLVLGDARHIRSADHRRTVHRLGHSDDNSGRADEAPIEQNVTVPPNHLPRSPTSQILPRARWC
jgi:hypothetical protein